MVVNRNGSSPLRFLALELLLSRFHLSNKRETDVDASHGLEAASPGHHIGCDDISHGYVLEDRLDGILKFGFHVWLVELVRRQTRTRQADCKHHFPLKRYVHPDEFDELGAIAKDLGFSHAASGPMVRSSYHADKQAAGEEVK